MFCFGRFFWFSCLFGVIPALIFFPCGAGCESEMPPTALQVKQNAEASVKIRRMSQKRIDAWADEEEKMRSEISSLEKDLDTLKWRRQKTDTYLLDLEQKMAALNEGSRAAKEIQDELEPFLEKTLQDLEAFSENELPSLRELQSPGLQSAKEMQNDADADMVRKTRGLLEVLMRAVEYGYFVEPDQTDIGIDEKTIRVKRISVGRLGLFALSADGDQAWKWQTEKEQYEPIPHFAGAIREAIQICERRRLVELVKLPMGPPVSPPVSSDKEVKK